LPGVGSQLARLLHERLGITTLEELERAAHAGQLGSLGIGPKRLRGLIDALAGRLGRYRQAEPIHGEPSVAELLAVDSAYREKASLNCLPTVAPRRFNMDHEPWLPLYQEERSGWHCRAAFSNTALAHRLRQTHDWVVINFDDGVSTGQRTVVTETRGDLRGQRVVRGREGECRAHYQSEPARTVTPRAS
jgi:DNA polymerase (family X)